LSEGRITITGENAIKSLVSKLGNPFPLHVGKNAKIEEKACEEFCENEVLIEIVNECFEEAFRESFGKEPKGEKPNALKKS